MSHINEDQLLLYAWSELPDDEREPLEAHLRTCAECRGRFAVIEESRVALDWGLEVRTKLRIPRLAWLALPLAAGIGALLLSRSQPDSRPVDIPVWRSNLVASPHAGYLTTSLIAIDSQLVRLERGRINAPQQD